MDLVIRYMWLGAGFWFHDARAREPTEKLSTGFSVQTPRLSSLRSAEQHPQCRQSLFVSR